MTFIEQIVDFVRRSLSAFLECWQGRVYNWALNALRRFLLRRLLIKPRKLVQQRNDRQGSRKNPRIVVGICCRKHRQCDPLQIVACAGFPAYERGYYAVSIWEWRQRGGPEGGSERAVRPWNDCCGRAMASLGRRTRPCCRFGTGRSRVRFRFKHLAPLDPEEWSGPDPDADSVFRFLMGQQQAAEKVVVRHDCPVNRFWLSACGRVHGAPPCDFRCSRSRTGLPPYPRRWLTE